VAERVTVTEAAAALLLETLRLVELGYTSTSNVVPVLSKALSPPTFRGFLAYTLKVAAPPAATP
jgi:hypothetical protein